MIKKATEKSVQRNQAMQAALKALEEDPTIFQYDELYDGMQEKKEEKKPVEAERKVYILIFLSLNVLDYQFSFIGFQLLFFIHVKIVLIF